MSARLEDLEAFERRLVADMQGAEILGLTRILDHLAVCLGIVRYEIRQLGEKDGRNGS